MACPILAQRFHRGPTAVNMSPAAIRAWAKDPRAKRASWASTRARLPRLAALKAKPRGAWTARDCAYAERVLAFNARMLGMRRAHGCTPKIVISLRNWGHQPRGCAIPR